VLAGKVKEATVAQNANAIGVAEQPAGEPRISIMRSAGFALWLAETGGSLAFTTYKAGKLLLIGVKPDGDLARQSVAPPQTERRRPGWRLALRNNNKPAAGSRRVSTIIFRGGGFDGAQRRRARPGFACAVARAALHRFRR